MSKKNDKKKPPKKELRKIEEAKAAKKLAKKKAERKAAEAKAEKKAKKKRDAHIDAQKKDAEVTTVDPTASLDSSESGDAERHPHLQHLDRVGELVKIIESKKSSKKGRRAAEKELDALHNEGIRLENERKARRAELAGSAEEIDAKIAERLAAKRGRSEKATAEMQTAVETEGQVARVREILDEGKATAADEKKAKKRAEGNPPAAVVEGTEDVAAKAAEILAPQTFADDDFGNPSEAKHWEDDTNGNGQYKVKRLSDGKEIGYTRVTTFIDTLEDKTTLTAWKMRILMEGIAADLLESERDGSRGVPIMAQVNDIAHRRDVAIAKARKADRKGKLVPGQLATLVDGAYSDFKKALNILADEAFEIGGGREKANKGTSIHGLTEVHDRDGIQEISAMLEREEITPADHADVEAYANAMRAIGAKITASEQVVVDDDGKIGGRLDRVVLAKLPEVRDPKTDEVIRPADTRARRYVLDIKTGRVDLGAGKIAMQLRKYAESKAYDPETGERTSHGANRDTGLLLHLPAGSAKATIHIVDLSIGAVGNKLSTEVRAYRNAGKRAIHLGVDLATLTPVEAS